MENKQKVQITPEMMAAQWSLLYRKNEIFRADFDKDPKATISTLLGQEFPQDVEIVVHHSKPGQVHVVVPEEMRGMSDAQLKDVSGGTRLGFMAPSRGNSNWGDGYWSEVPSYPPRNKWGDIMPHGPGERPG
ncbi:MAG: hypothetical protein OXU44_04910 [Gammaproteobacteria bacterium]|nr:hypothetical protein [Gammaproteobacteria bacterium]